MDHEINMKSFKYVDPVLIEHQCDVSLYNSVYSRFTIKHYCTIDKAYRRNIQFEKVARSPSKLRSLKYMLCPPRYSFRKAHIPDIECTMRLLKRRKRNTGLKCEVWLDI